MEKAPVSQRLKSLRERAGISVRQMANLLGMPSASSYSHYENRYKKDFLPYDLFLKLKEIFNEHGLNSDEVSALFGPGALTGGQSVPGFGEAKSPRIDVSVLLDEQPTPQNSPADEAGTIKLAIVGDTIQIAATVKAEGIDELIRRINLARQMIE